MVVPTIIIVVAIGALLLLGLVAAVATGALIRAQRELAALRTTLDAYRVELGHPRLWPLAETSDVARIRRPA